MFDSLADRIKADEHQEVKTSERVVRWVVVFVIAVILVGGLYLGVQMLEG